MKRLLVRTFGGDEGARHAVAVAVELVTSGSARASAACSAAMMELFPLLFVRAISGRAAP